MVLKLRYKEVFFILNITFYGYVTVMWIYNNFVLIILTAKFSAGADRVEPLFWGDTHET